MNGEERFLRNMAVKSAYLDGQSAHHVAHAHGMHIQSVYYVLRSMDVQRRSRGAPKGPRAATKVNIAKARELRRQGLKLREIAQLLGFTRQRAQQLAAIGLAEKRPHRGVLVANFTIERMRHMFELMAELEALCARLAARRMIPDAKALLVNFAKLFCILARRI